MIFLIKIWETTFDIWATESESKFEQKNLTFEEQNLTFVGFWVFNMHKNDKTSIKMQWWVNILFYVMIFVILGLCGGNFQVLHIKQHQFSNACFMAIRMCEMLFVRIYQFLCLKTSISSDTYKDVKELLHGIKFMFFFVFFCSPSPKMYNLSFSLFTKVAVREMWNKKYRIRTVWSYFWRDFQLNLPYCYWRYWKFLRAS